MKKFIIIFTVLVVLGLGVFAGFSIQKDKIDAKNEQYAKKITIDFCKDLYNEDDLNSDIDSDDVYKKISSYLSKSYIKDIENIEDEESCYFITNKDNGTKTSIDISDIAVETRENNYVVAVVFNCTQLNAKEEIQEPRYCIVTLDKKFKITNVDESI